MQRVVLRKERGPFYWSRGKIVKRSAFAFAVTLLLAGCGTSSEDPEKGGVTRVEADALDQAAEQLDRQAAAANTNQAPAK